MDNFSKDFDKHMNELKIKKSDHLLVYSNLSSFGSLNKNLAKNILHKVLQRIGKRGTLFMPAYTFNVSSNYVFRINILNKNFSTSSLTKYFFKFPKIKRSLRPIHSHIGIGYKDYILSNLKNPYQSFDNNTDFDLMKKNKFKCLFLGCSPAEGGTYFLHVEHMLNVPHRKNIILKKKILYKQKIINTYINYSSRGDFTLDKYDLNGAFKKIEKKLKTLKKSKLRFGMSYIFDLYEFDKIIIKKIKKNSKFLIRSNVSFKSNRKK